MPRWAMVSVVAVVPLVAGILYWAVRSWDDSQPLRTPAKATPAEATFRCAAVFGHDRPPVRVDHSPRSYALTRPPCDTRSSQRNYVIADFIVIATGAAIAFGASRRAAASTDGRRAVTST